MAEAQRRANVWSAVALGAISLALLYFTIANSVFASAGTFARRKNSFRSVLATDHGHEAAGLQFDRGPTKRPTKSKASPAEIQELLSQVSRDLAPWKESGITLEMVEKAYCTEEIVESMRIQIINGSAYLVGPTGAFQSRARAMQLPLAELAAKYELPDADFVLTTSDKCKPKDAPHRSHDGNLDRCTALAPLFNIDKAPQESHCVPVPDFAFGGWPEAFLPDWRAASRLVSAAAKQHPWEERRDVIFWRGGDTNTERKVLSESELVQSSGLADVHLMSWGTSPEDFASNFVSLGDHCTFRYLLHVAGRTYSSRLKFIMLCGSAVVFPHRREQEPVEFWYHMLRDRENVLLVDSVNHQNMGMPVLKAVVELRGNDTLARSVGIAAQHLAAEILHPDNVERYWVELLQQYSNLQKFSVVRHADAVPLETALLRPERLLEVKQRTCTVC